MFTLSDIRQACGDSARFYGLGEQETERSFPAAHHDSRQLQPGDLFIALKGQHVDGHRFIAEAARKGAGGVLCSQPSEDVPSSFLQIVVPDVLQALHAIARERAQRQQDTIFIGITGSNGKTSTKEAIATVLSRQAPTLKTFASYNNEIGYPLTLLRLEPQHRYAVLEMGAQWVGELAWLCRTIARPHWSVITNVGSAHLEFFKSVEGIVQAKGELVEALSPEGIAFLNYDDPRVRGMAARTRARVVYYGTAEQAEVRAIPDGGDPLRGRRFLLSYHGEQCAVQLHIPGDHGIYIATAAAAVGCAAGLPLSEIRAALESLTPVKGRGEIKPGPNGSTLIDDSYNASAESIIAIVRAMQATPVADGGRRWAVLGDIFELGPYAEREHRRAGEAIGPLIDHLVAIGDQARYYVEGALAAGLSPERTHYFPADPHDRAALEEAKRAAAALLAAEVQPADLVLLKGSRGMAMETLLSLWPGDPQAPGEQPTGLK
ncbi:UDP-N-acetylmuramoyl-tripeptide--D-alanyl-D-alanine ligase [Thermogemmatispora sp.]|uniref:UDP-N-acetylmuramoyl-tripeptide--D-alanyl-D- alanine ligase n=1 Tax=Thermogemmatispora sp. TaxID=1968838 RepID=UPI001E099B2A|nr:UDP-N-acetylmuramoyl-tripeptide--D-alanyl-D-alanine ligase [Thermogemmatispora sp.]MBX5448932.1 UDP-N-acetylmuramoyl-tripeptide--D-alanyl-D-alanine ligase [Thermogemmatispora sp.]